MITVRMSGSAWLAEWVGEKGPTQAVGTDPWDAAARVCRFMVYRFSSGWEPGKSVTARIAKSSKGKQAKGDRS